MSQTISAPAQTESNFTINDYLFQKSQSEIVKYPEAFLNMIVQQCLVFEKCELRLGNLSKRKIAQIATCLEHNPNMPQPYEIACKINRSAWVLRNGQAYFEGEIKEWKQGVAMHHICLESFLLSTIRPYNYPVQEIISSLHHSLNKSIAFRELDLGETEWRFEITYFNKSCLDAALKTLTEKGFTVSIHFPYLKVDFDADKKVRVLQELAIGLPKDLSIPENPIIENYPFYKSECSAYNFLVEHNTAAKKSCYVEYLQHEPISKQTCLIEISKQLQYLACQSPLLKKLACPISGLAETDRPWFLQSLQSLGFNAVIDKPFIVHKSFGPLIDWQVLIDLP